MELNLKDRVALITGASSGFGAHFARLFVREGARVIIGARRLDRIAALERLARSLYRSLSSQPQPQARALDLESARLACDLLDLEPPGFDPSTEGP